MENHIADKPEFSWWVPYTLKKARVKTKYWRNTHKYGVSIPKNVTEAMWIDQENDTNIGRTQFKKI